MSAEISNNHKSISVSCPECHRQYLIQQGGQKSGSSPAVRIIHEKKDDYGNIITPARTVGYCSAFCCYKAGGQNYDDYNSIRIKMGLPPESPDYLAPARIPNGSHKCRSPKEDK